MVPAGSFMLQVAKMPNSTANSASWKMQDTFCARQDPQSDISWVTATVKCRSCADGWLSLSKDTEDLFVVFLLFWSWPWCYRLLLVFLAGMILQSEQEPSCGPSFMNKFLVFCSSSLVHVYSLTLLNTPCLSAAAAPLHRLWHSSGVQGTKTEDHAQSSYVIWL